MSRGKQDAVVIIWDCGLSSLQQQKDGKTFIEASKMCLKKIIGNKLLVQQKDLLGIITFGTEETENSLAENGGFDNICLGFPLQPASLDMIEVIDKVASTNIEGDWMGAICVALQCIKETTYKLGKKTIVLLSPLTKNVNSSELKSITKGFLKLEATLILIGCNIDLEEGSDTTEEEEDSVPISEAFLQMKGNNVPVVAWSFPQAMQSLTKGYTSKLVNPRPWKTELEIGSRIKIRVCGFNEITFETRLTFKQLSEPDIAKVPQREVSFFEKASKRKLVDTEEVIQGHKFGTSIVPFSKEDQTSLKYQSGPACLSVIGFVDRKRIPPPMYIKDGIQTFCGDENDPVSMMAFSALVRALYAENMVALVRKVVRENYRLIMGALLPQLRAEGERLVLVELPFAQDLRHYTFRNFHPSVTQEQLDCIDEMMDNMDLMNTGPKNEEAFAPRDISDPTLVYLNESILYRALHGLEHPLPPPSELVKSLLDIPEKVKLASKKLQPKLDAAFPKLDKERKVAARPLKPRKQTEEKPEGMQPGDTQTDTQPEVQPINTTDDVQSKAAVSVVGTVTPVEDFQALLRSGRPLNLVFNQCADVVLQLALQSRTVDLLGKPISAVRVMRDTCCQLNPEMYNTWVRGLEAALQATNRTLLWDAIKSEKLGLISQLENPGSSVSEQEAQQFLDAADTGDDIDDMD